MDTSSELREEIITIIRKIIRAVDLQSKRLVKEFGLTGPQLLILKELKGKEAVMVSELAVKINVSQSTVTNILDR